MISWRTLWFIRHAETDLAGTFCGQADPPLNDRGRSQLPALAARLRGTPLSAVYSSNLQRAKQTAEAVAAEHALPITLLDSLREIAFGRWEGLTWEQIEQRDPEYAQHWVAEFPALPTPGGESIAAFRARVLRALEELQLAPAGDIAIVTHSGVLRVLLEEIGHFSPHHAWERTRDYTCVIACTQHAPGARLEIFS